MTTNRCGRNFTQPGAKFALRCQGEFQCPECVDRERINNEIVEAGTKELNANVLLENPYPTNVTEARSLTDQEKELLEKHHYSGIAAQFVYGAGGELVSDTHSKGNTEDIMREAITESAEKILDEMKGGKRKRTQIN